jgi:hypothetical protein
MKSVLYVTHERRPEGGISKAVHAFITIWMLITIVGPWAFTRLWARIRGALDSTSQKSDGQRILRRSSDQTSLGRIL